MSLVACMSTAVAPPYPKNDRRFGVCAIDATAKTDLKAVRPAEFDRRYLHLDRFSPVKVAVPESLGEQKPFVFKLVPYSGFAHGMGATALRAIGELKSGKWAAPRLAGASPQGGARLRPEPVTRGRADDSVGRSLGVLLLGVKRRALRRRSPARPTVRRHLQARSAALTGLVADVLRPDFANPGAATVAGSALRRHARLEDARARTVPETDPGDVLARRNPGRSKSGRRKAGRKRAKDNEPAEKSR